MFTSILIHKKHLYNPYNTFKYNLFARFVFLMHSKMTGIRKILYSKARPFNLQTSDFYENIKESCEHLELVYHT